MEYPPPSAVFMKIKGRIVRGVGESGSFLCIPWVSEELRKSLEFKPYPGTVNVRIESGDVQKTLKAHGGQRLVARQDDFCDALVFHCSMHGYECGIVLPLVPNYAEDVLEVVAPVRLKDALHLRDGDEVTIEIEL